MRWNTTFKQLGGNASSRSYLKKRTSSVRPQLSDFIFLYDALMLKHGPARQTSVYSFGLALGLCPLSRLSQSNSSIFYFSRSDYLCITIYRFLTQF